MLTVKWFNVNCEKIPKSAMDNEDIIFFVVDVSEISKISKFLKH